MTSEFLKDYSNKHGVLKTIEVLAGEFNLLLPNVTFSIRPNAEVGLLLTTEGVLGVKEIQNITIPENVFSFNVETILSLLSHEIHHVQQRTHVPIVYNKYEREFQAYYEGVFPFKFIQLPAISDNLRKQFAQKALHYFNGFEVGSELYVRYLSDKYRLEEYLIN